jgi:hypothetical protein
VEGDLEPILEHYGTSKKNREDKGTSNYNLNGCIEDYITQNHVEKKKKKKRKEKLKSYFL